MELRKYQEHHYEGMKDVGIAWNTDRIWVCLDGQTLLRIKIYQKADGEVIMVVDHNNLDGLEMVQIIVDDVHADD